MTNPDWEYYNKMDDGTDRNPVQTWRAGLITQLSERQSEVQELIKSSRDQPDKTLEDGLTGNLGYDDEVVTALVLAMKENSPNPQSDVTNFEVILAGGVLDDLDTLGFEIRHKKRRR